MWTRTPAPAGIAGTLAPLAALTAALGPLCALAPLRPITISASLAPHRITISVVTPEASPTLLATRLRIALEVLAGSSPTRRAGTATARTGARSPAASALASLAAILGSITPTRPTAAGLIVPTLAVTGRTASLPVVAPSALAVATKAAGATASTTGR